MKNRAPRQSVIETVEGFEEPFTVDELQRQARKRRPGIGRASVYRTLNKLLEENTVRQVTLPSGERLFVTPTMRVSTLLYCENCRTVQSLQDEDLHEHIVRKMRDLGFKTEGAPICLSVRCDGEHRGK